MLGGSAQYNKPQSKQLRKHGVNELANVPQGKVACMVKGYEIQSLSQTSRPYSAIPPSLSPRHGRVLNPARQENNNTSPVREKRFEKQERGSSPKVPAAFFQNQQTRKDPISSEPTEVNRLREDEGKENKQHKFSIMASHISAADFSSYLESVDSSKENSVVGLYDSSRPTMSDSKKIGERFESSPTKVPQSRSAILDDSKRERFTPQCSPGSRDRVRESPSLQRSPLVSKNHKLLEQFPTPKLLASDVERMSYDAPLSPSTKSPLAMSQHSSAHNSTPPRRAPVTPSSLINNLVKPVVTPLEKAERVNQAFGHLLDSMELADRSVRVKMQGLTIPLKEDMLRAAALTSSNSSSIPSSVSNHGNKVRSTSSHVRAMSLEVSRSSNSASSTPLPQRARAYSNATTKDSISPSFTQSKTVSSSSPGRNNLSSFLAPVLRRSKSQASLLTPSIAYEEMMTNMSGDEGSGGFRDQLDKSKQRRPIHRRNESATSFFRSLGRSTSRSNCSSGSSKSNEIEIDTYQQGTKDKEDAIWWAVRMRTAKCKTLEVKVVGRLRGRLRGEAPDWVDTFLTHGGLLGILERLKELLDVEWREEQHDDQLLLELVRCLKALTLTTCGKKAIAQRSPQPFVALTSLLLSEKRPGDLSCRQVLVELLLSLFSICPVDAQQVTKVDWKSSILDSIESRSFNQPITTIQADVIQSGEVRRYTRKAKAVEGNDMVDDDDDDENFGNERRYKTLELVCSLMRGSGDETEEAKVDFVQTLHKPREYKRWINELSDIVRDYFWIFCHTQNSFWSLEAVNVTKVEAPSVPSGMTGGVEFEAMAYCTTHLKLLNTVAATFPDQMTAFNFHNSMFESGLERILLTLRRASATYYRPLHLEMARYIALARSAHFSLGARILSYLDPLTLSNPERRIVEAAMAAAAKHKRGGGTYLPELAFNR